MKIEPEPIINETATIKGASIEKVYDQCKDWLKSVDAQILDESKPHFIKAIHTINIMKNHAQEKYFLISLTQETSPFQKVFSPTNTIISFKIHRPTGYHFWHLPWVEYVESLWRHISVPMDNNMLRHLYPKKHLIPLKNDSRNHYLQFMAMVVFLVAIALSFIRSNVIFSIGIFLLAAIGFVLFAMPHQNKSRQYKTMMQELYPD